MNVNVEQQQAGPLDKVLWLLVIAALAGTVGVYHYLEKEQISFLIRVIAVIVGLGVSFGLAFNTKQGAALLVFGKESRIEVRKVVWPTRQESTQTTLIVLGVTLIMGILFFPLDAALVWLVNLVTGV